MWNNFQFSILDENFPSKVEIFLSFSLSRIRKRQARKTVRICFSTKICSQKRKCCDTKLMFFVVAWCEKIKKKKKVKGVQNSLASQKDVERKEKKILCDNWIRQSTTMTWFLDELCYWLLSIHRESHKFRVSESFKDPSVTWIWGKIVKKRCVKLLSMSIFKIFMSDEGFHLWSDNLFCVAMLLLRCCECLRIKKQCSIIYFAQPMVIDWWI